MGLIELINNPFAIMVAASACVFFTTYLIFHFILHVYNAQKAAGSEIIVVDASPGLMRSFLPMARAIGTTLRASLNGQNKNSVYYRFSEGIARQLVAAGNPEGLNADEFVGFGVLYGLLWSSLALAGLAMLGTDNIFSLKSLYLALIAFGFGGLLWKGWLSNKQNIRQTSIRRQLPFALDLLTLAIEAGLDFTSALARIVSKIGNAPLGQEFSLMLHEIQLGKSRSEAMRDFAARCDVQEVRTVVASLVQAEELGSSIGLVLRIQSAQQRERRSQLAEEKAMKAPVKMLFPMIFILLALMVIIAAPIVISFVQEGF